MPPSLSKYLGLCFFVMTFLVGSVPDVLADLRLQHPPLRNPHTALTLPSFSSLQLCMKCFSAPKHRTSSLGQAQQAQSVHEPFGYVSAYIWLYASLPVVAELVLLVGNAVSLHLQKGQVVWGVIGTIISVFLVPLTLGLHISFGSEMMGFPLAHLHFVAFYVLEIFVTTLSILNLVSHTKQRRIAVLPWVNLGARGDLQTGLSFSATF